jgi:uncharacterized OsmC-like protein
MSEAYRVRLRTVGDGPMALGEGRGATLVVDRPVAAGGGGLGFSGGQLFYLSIAACVSNDLMATSRRVAKPPPPSPST